MLRSCHVAIICDQSNSFFKMLMVDAQKLSSTLVRQMILLFLVPQEDLIQARSQVIFYNVTLRLGRNLRKGKVVLSTCFLLSCSKVPSDDAIGTFSTESFHSDGDVGGRRTLGRGRRCSRQNINL